MSLFITIKGNDEKLRIIVIFGTGLVGTAIGDGLRSAGNANLKQVAYEWFDSDKQDEQLSIIEKNIAELYKYRTVCAIHVVWSAGKAGFNANEQETDIELDNYLKIVDFTKNLSSTFENLLVVYHAVSSAGGLFEGQRHVTAGTSISPKRPYSWLKVKQENTLYEIEPLENFKKCIYRLSSVYTYIMPGQRLGLITTLIINGIRQNISYITGSLTTIRDYVFAPDIGRYFSLRLMGNNFSNDIETLTLVSGKPTTIHEIKKRVESTINKRIYVNYSLHKTNEENISFSQSLIPKKFENTDMRTAITMIFNKISKSGAPF